MRPLLVLTGLVLAPLMLRAQEPAITQEQWRALAEEVTQQGAALEALTERLRADEEALGIAMGKQALAAELERSRIDRIHALDALLDEAVALDLALMGGTDSPSDEVTALQDDVASVRAEAGRASGRQEWAGLLDAENALAWMQQALRDGDFYLARCFLAGAADGLASARASAAGNPQRAWSDR